LRLWAALERRHIDEIVRRRLNDAANVMRFEQLDQIGGWRLRKQHREPRTFDIPPQWLFAPR
jgi:hypothetical protein